MRKILSLLLVCVLNVSAFSLFEEEPNPRAQKVQYLDSLKDLIVATQKTRGLTNNFMSGNVVAQLLVYGERSEMKKALRSLKKQGETVDSGVQKQVADLKKGLKKLDKVAFKQDAAKTFQDYTDFIDKMLIMGAQTAHISFDQDSVLSKKASYIMMEVVLPLTENIGKTRGLGSGIVARGHCKEKEISKMNGFINEIERYSAIMLKEMTILYKQHRDIYSADIIQKIEAINTKIDNYIELSRNKVIGKQEITLDPNAYFDQGTAAISDVTTIFLDNKSAILKE